MREKPLYTDYAEKADKAKTGGIGCDHFRVARIPFAGLAHQRRRLKSRRRACGRTSAYADEETVQPSWMKGIVHGGGRPARAAVARAAEAGEWNSRRRACGRTSAYADGE